MNEFELYISLYAGAVALSVMVPILHRVGHMLRLRPRPKRMVKRRGIPGDLATLREPQRSLRVPAPPIDVPAEK